MISLYRWTKSQCEGEWLEAAALLERADELRAAETLWIDLDHPTEEEEELVYRQFLPIHALTVEDITRLRREPKAQPHFPKVEEFPDYLFVIVNPLTERLLGRVQRKPEEFSATDGQATTQLSAILNHKVLITHHYEPIPSVQELRTFLSKHPEQAERGPDFLFHLVLDAMVDQYAPVLDHLEDLLDDIESKVFGKPTQRLLVRLLKLKRSIIHLRKTLIYEREVLARLCRGEFALIDVREMVYYRNVYDHLVRFNELIESSREMVSDLLQTHLAATSNKLNEIMKVLTMISTVVLPMTLVAGVYGMNFDRLPELHWPWGYPFALALMALTGFGSLAYFKWKKWL